MNVLIMVLSSKKAPYDAIEKAQRETWDSIKVEGVTTYYYYGEDYDMMHWAFKKALDSCWRKKWDVIFRTNSSTYVRKDKIKEWVEANQPKSNLYGGVALGTMVSGTGILMTRDVAKILRDNLDSHPTASEDCCIGTLLDKHGIQPQIKLHREHFNFQADDIKEADYYRCKSEITMEGKFGYDNLDRSYDVIAMHKLYVHFSKSYII